MYAGRGIRRAERCRRSDRSHSADTARGYPGRRLQRAAGNTEPGSTAGLAAHMGIPAMTPEVFLEHQARGPAGLLEYIMREMATYDSRRRTLAATMRDFIAGNGLTPHAGLVALAG